MEARRGSGLGGVSGLEARMRASTSGNGPPVQARVGRRSPRGQAGRCTSPFASRSWSWKGQTPWRTCPFS